MFIKDPKHYLIGRNKRDEYYESDLGSSDMEANYDEQQAEERRTALLGKKEDER
jgi:hypothetical protein